MDLRIALDLIISMRYKLRTFGIKIDRSDNVFCDNESAYRNSSFDKLQSKNNHQYIYLRRVRDCVAAGILIPHKVNTN